MENQKFKINSISGEVSCDVPVNLDGVKSFVKGKVEFLDVQASIKFIEPNNFLVEEVENHAVDFVGFARAFRDLSDYKRSKLDGSVTSQVTIHDFEFRDTFLAMHKAVIKLKAPDEPQPLPTLIEAYRTLGFNLKNVDTITVLKRLINREHAGTGHVTYRTPEELVAYLRHVDLQQDRAFVKELADSVNTLIDSYKAKATTDAAQEVIASLRKATDEQAADFKKRSDDPVQTPMGAISVSRNVDNALGLTLQDIAVEAAEAWHVEKPSEPSIWTRVRGTLQPHRGAVGFPPDEGEGT